MTSNADPSQKENCSAKKKENANGPKSHETEGGIATDAVEEHYMEEEESVDAMTKKSALSINVTEAKATDETKVDRANISSSETVENKTKEDESMERNHVNESVLQDEGREDGGGEEGKREGGNEIESEEGGEKKEGDKEATTNNPVVEGVTTSTSTKDDGDARSKMFELLAKVEGGMVFESSPEDVKEFPDVNEAVSFIIIASPIVFNSS